MHTAYILTVAMALWVVHPGCVSSRLRPQPDSAPAVERANGVFVRYIRLNVVPSHIAEFELLLKSCAKAAAKASLPESYTWLCYREAPCSYWLIVFSDTVDGFATPDDFALFARALGKAGSGETAHSIENRLAEIDYTVERQVISQQYMAWSTVENMTTATHPKARASFYAIKPNASAAFSQAMAARTRFLTQHSYPLPVEGFVILRGGSNQAMQVVFPGNWEDYRKRDSVRAFVERLDEPSRCEFQRLDSAVAETVQNIEHFDADFADELRYIVK